MANFTEFADFADPDFVTWQPPALGIRRRPVFSIGFHDYLERPNGLMNLMEIVGGVALYVLMTTGKRDSKAVRFLAGTACTFGFNGVYMMLSCMMSATSAYYLPRLFYYIVFQGTGAACYLVSSLYIVRDSHQVAVQPIIGFLTGGVHAMHFAYTSYKKYYAKRDTGWF